MRQLNRSDTGRLYGLGNEGVDVFKFRRRDFNVDATHNVNGIHDSFPVEGDIVIRLYIEIVAYHPERLFRSAFEISFIEFMVFSGLINLHEGVTVNAADAYVSGLLIQRDQHVHIGKGIFPEIAVSRIHAEYGYGIIAARMGLLTQQEIFCAPDNKKYG